VKTFTSFLFVIFLFVSSLELGRQIDSPSLPIPIIIMGALGLSFYILILALLLVGTRLARRGSKKGKRWLQFWGKG